MTDTKGSTRFDSIDRIIALSVVLLGAAACSKDSTAPIPEPNTVAIVGGAAQTATVNTALAAPVAVRVTDQSGNPMAGVQVSFTDTTQVLNTQGRDKFNCTGTTEFQDWVGL